MDAASGSAHRGTLRALSVLKAVSEEGGHNVSRLARLTGISRQALYRILSALNDAGYLDRDPNGEGYILTPLVTSLSTGFREQAWVTGIVAPILGELQRTVVWPIDLATSVGDAMYLRVTTRRESPLVIERRSTGYRLPMLISAVGKAYISYCPDAERALILRTLVRSNAPEDRIAQDEKAVYRIIKTTRENGYGYRLSEVETMTGTIAVPLFLEDRVFACVALTFFSKAMTPNEASQQYLSILTATARRIEQDLGVGPLDRTPD